jgi:hypothetical protein
VPCYDGAKEVLTLAEKHPYSPGPGGIAAAIAQFRKSFPKTVNAETLKQLGIAPSNESYVINVLRYVGAIDADGKRTEKAELVFSKHTDEDFQKAFEEMVKESYADLFALHRDSAWGLPTDKLIAFFRSTDKTTDLVGRLQATTFQLLAGFAGHGSVPEPTPLRTSRVKVAKPKAGKDTGTSRIPALPASGGEGTPRDVGLTVRIEVNLPPQGDQETYDRIFRSIRENLLNAK